MRAVDTPVRRRAHDELRISAGSESLSGGQGHVGGRQGGQAGRHDHLRGRVPRRPAESRFVRRGARVAAVAAGAARDDSRAGLRRARCLAGADSGADPDESAGAGEEQLHAARGHSRRPPGTDRRRRRERAPGAGRRRRRRRRCACCPRVRRRFPTCDNSTACLSRVTKSRRPRKSSLSEKIFVIFVSS